MYRPAIFLSPTEAATAGLPVGCQDGHMAMLMLSMQKARSRSIGFRRLRQEFGNSFVVRHSSSGELAGGQRRTPLPVPQNSAEREQGALTRGKVANLPLMNS
jgi:hypothetical protein